MDIDGAIELFLEKDAESVISCVEMDHPTDWIFTVNNNGTIKRSPEYETKKMMNRQSLDTAYIPNGGVSVYKSSLLLENYSYYSKRSFAYAMPPERSVDIDTEFDFEFIEFLISRKISP
jgi:CMP-N,N'-diacetyllegionaminic acid synthase